MTMFSLEPAGSREIIKSWVYPTIVVEMYGHRPPDEVLEWIKANRPGHPHDGSSFCEREFGNDGHRVGSRSHERLIHRIVS